MDRTASPRARMQALLVPTDDSTRALSRQVLAEALAQVESRLLLPDDPADLSHWLDRDHHQVTAAYAAYQERRRAGGDREYFPRRAHALHALSEIAPTKLVDGAWLYGTLTGWNQPECHDLIHTYLEELGDGQGEQNHVLLYRHLLADLDALRTEQLQEDRFLPATLQLALGHAGLEYLPEVTGFNLGYEQLPLHLLITAHELAELGLDPYYFTLHVTIDNGHSGHACRAQRAVWQLLQHSDAPEQTWQRIRRGHALNQIGPGILDVLASFDLQAHLEQLLMAKARAGCLLHRPQSRLGGESVNSVLQRVEDGGALLRLMLEQDWLRPGQPAEASRFWNLLHDPHSRMYGVFNRYEKQILLDWLQVPASRQPSLFPPLGKALKRRRSGLAPARAPDPIPQRAQQEWRRRLQPLSDRSQQMQVLLPWLAPGRHDSPMGLQATRLFRASLHGRSLPSDHLTPLASVMALP